MKSCIIMESLQVIALINNLLYQYKIMMLLFSSRYNYPVIIILKLGAQIRAERIHAIIFHV